MGRNPYFILESGNKRLPLETTVKESGLIKLWSYFLGLLDFHCGVKTLMKYSSVSRKPFLQSLKWLKSGKGRIWCLDSTLERIAGDDGRSRMILGLISNWWWNFLPWIINHLLTAPGGKTIHTIQNYPQKTEILAKMLSRNIHFLGCAKHQKVEHSLRADDVCPWLLLVKA